jgi:hypothetical protein
VPTNHRLSTLLDRFVTQLAGEIATRARRELGPVAGPGKRGARHKLDMRCRVDGCKNRSRGPRFGYICDVHQEKLNKRQQQAARDAWNEKRGVRRA